MHTLSDGEIQPDRHLYDLFPNAPPDAGAMMANETKFVDSMNHFKNGCLDPTALEAFFYFCDAWNKHLVHNKSVEGTVLWVANGGKDGTQSFVNQASTGILPYDEDGCQFPRTTTAWNRFLSREDVKKRVTEFCASTQNFPTNSIESFLFFHQIVLSDSASTAVKLQQESGLSTTHYVTIGAYENPDEDMLNCCVRFQYAFRTEVLVEIAKSCSKCSFVLSLFAYSRWRQQ
jgi:hypothetical protein